MQLTTDVLVAGLVSRAGRPPWCAPCEFESRIPVQRTHSQLKQQQGGLVRRSRGLQVPKMQPEKQHCMALEARHVKGP